MGQLMLFGVLRGAVVAGLLAFITRMIAPNP
jgi:hypothetical protein